MPLRHSHDDEPGIRREGSAESGWTYRRPNGKVIRDKRTIERIDALAIPPAYVEVWICPDPDGHLQATGRDAAGRKQYRYHPEFQAEQGRNKFKKMLKFAKALPHIREAVRRDLARRGFPRERVAAAVVELLEKSLVRVGNEQYKEERGTVGLTTMDNRHLKGEGDELRFKFKGKSGVRWDVALKDRRVARAVRQIGDLPGQRLFQYIGEDGEIHPITSDDVNAYLKSIAGEEFSAKDFRTWAATVGSLQALAAISPWPEKKGERKRALNAAIKEIAERLGNTPSVCRNSYIHPRVIGAFEAGALGRAIRPGEDPDEAVARLLRKRKFA